MDGDGLVFDLERIGPVPLRIDRGVEREPDREVEGGSRPEDIALLPAGSETYVEVQVRDAVLTGCRLGRSAV